VGVAGS